MCTDDGEDRRLALVQHSSSLIMPGYPATTKTQRRLSAEQRGAVHTILEPGPSQARIGYSGKE